MTGPPAQRSRGRTGQEISGGGEQGSSMNQDARLLTRWALSSQARELPLYGGLRRAL